MRETMRDSEMFHRKACIEPMTSTNRPSGDSSPRVGIDADHGGPTESPRYERIRRAEPQKRSARLPKDQSSSDPSIWNWPIWRWVVMSHSTMSVPAAPATIGAVGDAASERTYAFRDNVANVRPSEASRRSRAPPVSTTSCFPPATNATGGGESVYGHLNVATTDPRGMSMSSARLLSIHSHA